MQQDVLVKEDNQGTNILVYGVVLMLLVFVARIQELFAFLIPLRLGMVSVFLSLLLFLFAAKPKVSVALLKISQVKIVLVIFALALFSIPFSYWPGHSFERAVEGFSVIIVFFLLVIYAVNNFKDLRKVIWSFVAGVFALAFFTVTSKATGRLTATYTYDPNDIAMLFVIALPIIYFFMSSNKGLARLALFGSLIVVLFAFILTASRGGFVGIVVISLLILIKDNYRSWMARIMLMSILIFSFVLFAPDTYWERIETIGDQADYNVQSDFGRKTLWLRGLGFMMENPLTGVGVGAFTTAIGHTYGQGVPGFRWQEAHNAFVQIGAELGVAGFILFILLIVSSMRLLRRMRAKYAHSQEDFKNHLWLTTALEISLWGYVVTAMFLSAAYSPMFYFLIALCCVLAKLELMEESREQTVERTSGQEKYGQYDYS